MATSDRHINQRTHNTVRMFNTNKNQSQILQNKTFPKNRWETGKRGNISKIHITLIKLGKQLRLYYTNKPLILKWLIRDSHDTTNRTTRWLVQAEFRLLANKSLVDVVVINMGYLPLTLWAYVKGMAAKNEIPLFC